MNLRLIAGVVTALMAIAFLMKAAAVTIMVLCRDNAFVFVILSAVVFFG